MKKKKITVKAVVDMVVWVTEDEQGNQDIIDIDDVLEIDEFNETYIHDIVEY